VNQSDKEPKKIHGHEEKERYSIDISRKEKKNINNIK